MNYKILLFFILIFSSGYAQRISPGKNNFSKKDTINILDSKGLKQGYWIVFGQSKPKSCYKPQAKVEEGNYKDNKKTGIWIEYFCNSNIKSKVTFTNGRPDGPATMYYENGKISEEGVWKINRWVGKCITGDKDGTIHEYFYDEKGGRYEIPKPPVPAPTKPTPTKKKK